MLEVFTKLTNSLVLSITGFYVIRIIIKSKKSINLKSLLILLFLSVLTTLLYKIQYKAVYTIAMFLINIIIYKTVFSITLEDSIILTSIFMVTLFLGDLLTAQVFRMFTTIEAMRTNNLLMFFSNTSVCVIDLIIINLKPFQHQAQKFYINGKKSVSIINHIFFVLLIIGFSLVTYDITVSTVWTYESISNILVMIIFSIIAYIFIKNKNSYSQLTDEYDNLFSYVQNFEEWIEKEQLNRHEYKNQLAVLRCLTKDKKIKEKIDEILEDNINIEDKVIHQLKSLPKGGIKGLMYYKVALAQKKKITVEVSVSLEAKSQLINLTEKDIRVLCKLIGIYLDNAIEAAAETRKRNILIEIYEIKDKVTFVFSNTFKKHSNFNKRNEKGVSSKGTGRGNGLYFASKLIANNSFIETKQDIVDNYYIQQLIINKKKK